MDTKVKIKNEVRIITDTPYNKDFIEGARALNGVWIPFEKVWIFNKEVEREVIELIEDIWGDEYKSDDF